MAKRKLKLESWREENLKDSGHGRIALYFNRPLSSLEQEGIIAILRGRLDNG